MSTDFIAEPVVAIVVAAGSGSRLGAAVPKALVPVAGVTLLRRSLTQLAAGGVQQAVVVVPAETAELFDADLLDAPLPVQRVVGGAQRQDSVAAGLAVLPDVIADAEALVLIHDAARAFVPSDVVARVIDAVRSGADAAIPVVPVADTIREVDEAGSHVIDRTRLRGVQTPQGFRRSIIEAAHAVLSDTGTPVTDDAAAVEYTGHEVTLVAGDRLAFKVTEPLDVALAVAVAGGAA
ncbi:2-C-methyl-D-erythritol 4-phosphate cytidylyltransferase [Propioniciclava flava]|jgi:2-C-methyl-D-erythritol 4-phosphate cytidylyltransferase|uniref:2-C-methyl-D-erythritol 4-phosphate cytidylyltransferase n=1 Tax=Propioniciclava flava TaxID=2072026 RepID=A0A4Q2EKE6_9ACTN|nr:2-C-methyl-D-erythritol 4-phosphate cytidylyltransferase [Propioniciclava flava]RXW32954.1 2-C-methyl-D-erythritol 4-phosphate cytidylyltransferase [Propioniciclava flava]